MSWIFKYASPNLIDRLSSGHTRPPGLLPWLFCSAVRSCYPNHRLISTRAAALRASASHTGFSSVVMRTASARARSNARAGVNEERGWATVLGAGNAMNCPAGFAVSRFVCMLAPYRTRQLGPDADNEKLNRNSFHRAANCTGHLYAQVPLSGQTGRPIFSTCSARTLHRIPRREWRARKTYTNK